jgi:hypothetical protein
MDTCWQWIKACDTGVTPLRIWKLTNSGDAPENCVIKSYFQYSRCIIFLLYSSFLLEEIWFKRLYSNKKYSLGMALTSPLHHTIFSRQILHFLKLWDLLFLPWVMHCKCFHSQKFYVYISFCKDSQLHPMSRHLCQTSTPSLFLVCLLVKSFLTRKMGRLFLLLENTLAC